MEAPGGCDELRALMPEAETADMILELRSLSLGQGWSTGSTTFAMSQTARPRR